MVKPDLRILDRSGFWMGSSATLGFSWGAWRLFLVGVLSLSRGFCRGFFWGPNIFRGLVDLLTESAVPWMLIRAAVSAGRKLVSPAVSLLLIWSRVELFLLISPGISITFDFALNQPNLEPIAQMPAAIIKMSKTEATMLYLPWKTVVTRAPAPRFSGAEEYRKV